MAKRCLTNRGVVTKTVWQYSKPLQRETMAFLRGIAEDYSKVKNYVYRRYSGIRSVNRLTPVYDILNEMRYCGLRTQLDLPVVYYELAIAEAVSDIKGMWGVLKNRIRERIDANENLSPDERAYIKTVLKINSVFAAILNQTEYAMPDLAVGLEIDVNRLNNLIRRLVRRNLSAPAAGQPKYFRVSPAGYKYKDGGLFLVSRIPRQRVYLPLKDDTTSSRQIQIHIKEDYVAIAIPVETYVKAHADYQNLIFIHIGYRDMFTLSNGNIYGAALNRLVTPETERLNQKNQERRKALLAYEKNRALGNENKAREIKSNNLGKKKYWCRKQREREKTQNFINAEINRMLKTEKAKAIVIPKLVTKGKTKYFSKDLNRRLTRSFGGYIRRQLAYKCQLNAIELVEINPKGTGIRCSRCGTEGQRRREEFVCANCGFRNTIALNSAKNLENLFQLSELKPKK